VIKLDLLTRRVVGQRLEHGATTKIDEELDKLIAALGGEKNGGLTPSRGATV
jgi:hypothetical protein